MTDQEYSSKTVAIVSEIQEKSFKSKNEKGKERFITALKQYYEISEVSRELKILRQIQKDFSFVNIQEILEKKKSKQN